VRCVVWGEMGKDERGERDMKSISHVRSQSSPGDVITQHNTSQLNTTQQSRECMVTWVMVVPLP
jgi:hypothetical protein